jgi:CheY-like chemotaxis protein
MPAEGGSAPGEITAPPSADDRTESGARILVVDDHEDNIEVLRLRLESWGYRTDAVYDGAAALRFVEQTPPDQILLDVMMPEVSGIEVARRVKANRSLPFIPIIMQTALDSTYAMVDGVVAGAHD